MLNGICEKLDLLYLLIPTQTQGHTLVLELKRVGCNDKTSILIHGEQWMINTSKERRQEAGGLNGTTLPPAALKRNYIPSFCSRDL